MTDREYDFWKSVFLADYSATLHASEAAESADAALSELRQRTASVPQPTAQDEAAATVAELRKRYQWLVLDEDGDLFDTRTHRYPVVKYADNVWLIFAGPDSYKHITFSSFADACEAVDWPAWDAAVKGSDE